jgi:uncharacterized iron-regulated protein
MPHLISASSRLLPALLALSGLAGCASARSSVVTAPASANASRTEGAVQRIIAAATAETITFAQLADAAAAADVVFFGEQHDDDETHRAELALLAAIGERRANVVLSLEMFERDVQSLVDAYLAGTIDDVAFRAQARPWPNYAADYRPLVELAKAKRWRVVAANVPRRLASGVSRRGLASIDSLPQADRALVAAELLCPKTDAYYKNFVAIMSEGHGGAGGTPAAIAEARAMTDRFYEAQCVKDETMAESIVSAHRAAGAGAIVVHYNGAFHSDFGLGTASRVRRRAPGARTVVVSAVPVPDVSASAAEFALRGDYIVLARRVKP